MIYTSEAEIAVRMAERRRRVDPAPPVFAGETVKADGDKVISFVERRRAA